MRHMGLIGPMVQMLLLESSFHQLNNLRSPFMSAFSRLIHALATAFVFAIISTAVFAQYDSKLYSGLRWRMVGPFRAGRVNAVSGVIGQPDTFYFGSVGGGVWKSANAGRTWTPVFDSTNVASIGAIG